MKNSELMKAFSAEFSGIQQNSAEYTDNPTRAEMWRLVDSTPDDLPSTRLRLLIFRMGWDLGGQHPDVSFPG